MAMKKVFFFVIVPIAFLVGVLVVFMTITKEKPPEGIKLALVDTMATNFPKDEKLARKEGVNNYRLKPFPYQVDAYPELRK